MHDATCLFRPTCEQLYSLTLAVPLKIESGTPLHIISLATQRAELPAYHCNVSGMVAAGMVAADDDGLLGLRLGFWALAAFINFTVL